MSNVSDAETMRILEQLGRDGGDQTDSGSPSAQGTVPGGDNQDQSSTVVTLLEQILHELRSIADDVNELRNVGGE